MLNTGSKRKIAALLLITAVIILATLLQVNRKTAPKSSFSMEGREKLSVTGEVAAVSNSSSMVYCVKDMLLEAQEGNLRVKNIKGNVAWTQKLQGKIVMLTDAGNNIVIIDSLNNINYYSLQGKLLWTHKLPSEIVDVFTEDSGSILVEYKGMTGSHAEVFTQNGSKIGTIAIENSHIISFSTGVSSYSITTLDTSADIVKTSIITYNFKGDILWAQNYDGKIISMLDYTKSGKLLALGEDTIYIYKNDGSGQDEVRLEGKPVIVAMADNIAAAIVDGKDKRYLICFDANMREQSKTEVGENTFRLFPAKNNLIIYSNDELLVLTVKGELLARYKSNMDINNVYMTTDNKIYIVSNRTLLQLEYQK